MRTLAILILWSIPTSEAASQFFPTRNAEWCAYSSSDGLKYWMPPEPDTLVGGLVYQKVLRFTCWSDFQPPGSCDQLTGNGYAYEQTILARSTPDGKGYVRAAMDTVDHLVGDIAAEVGDTVRNVLIFDDLLDVWQAPTLRPKFDVVVDSIVEVERWGVSVRRHFVHEVTFWNAVNHPPGFFIARNFFWQEGMGTSHGLVLRADTLTMTLYSLRCAMSGDSTVYSWYFGGTSTPPWGYPPGGPACCAPWDVGVAEHTTEPSVTTENPSSGLFRLNATTPINVAVFDAQGRLVTSVRGNEIDLTAQPPGVYTAVVRSAGGRAAVRLVVVR
jgi:hypothetical protein